MAISYGRGPAGFLYDKYPCGACQAYVPVATGCAHWNPGGTVRAERHRKYRLNDRQTRATRRKKLEEDTEVLLRQLTYRS